MGKIYGTIGYVETKETSPGVYREQVAERKYFGELNRNVHKWESSGNLNDNVNVANEISIVADPYAYEHYHSMRYVEFRGIKWKITSVEEQYPRLILTVGGVYADVEQA